MQAGRVEGSKVACPQSQSNWRSSWVNSVEGWPKSTLQKNQVKLTWV